MEEKNYTDIKIKDFPCCALTYKLTESDQRLSPKKNQDRSLKVKNFIQEDRKKGKVFEIASRKRERYFIQLGN